MQEIIITNKDVIFDELLVNLRKLQDGEEIEEPYLKEPTEDFNIEELNYEKLPEDCYFVMGDNREDSLDSREIGLVKEKEILGKVDLRIWPIFKIRNEK